MDAMEYDVVVVGGGAAGLTAAMMLARSRRRVAVVDAGERRNAPAAPARLPLSGRNAVTDYRAAGEVFSRT